MADQSSSSAIQKELVEDIYPCTPLQEGLIALSIEQPGAYVFQTVLRLPPSLDIERFKAAWEAVADSCSVLRTRIIYNVASGSLQVVMKDKIEWQYGTDLEKYLEQDKEILIRYGDRLTRYAIIDDGSDQTIFVWTAHHAVYDGWSVNLILERVNLVYNKTPIPETTTFSAFIKYLMNVSAEESDEYWISHLAGAHHVQYPPLPSVDHQLRTNQLFHHEVRKLPIIESDITMSTRIRAAWAIIMAHYEDSEDIVFGATVNGRNAPIVGIEDIVGPTIATVPIHVRVDPKQKIQDFLTTVQDQSTAMIPFEHKGLQNIKRLNSDSHNACDFRTLLAVSPLGNEDSKQDSSSIQNIPIPSKGFHTYALVAYILFGPGSVVIKAEYDNSVLMEAQVRTIMNQFEHVLRGLNGEETDATVDSVEMFSPQDKRDVWRWNSAQHTRIEACVHQVFERQVLAQPEAPAICAWDEDLTYRQLDDLSNRLAYHLNSLGVGPEVMVPLCFEKSAWVIVAMLGVLKAGGACVALDPSHPLGRLEGIICDVEASVILAADVTVGIFEPLAQKVLIIDSSFFDNLPTTCRRSSRNTVEPGNPAFVIFTSGSTGKPKGVVLEHASVCTSVEAHGSALQIGPDSRVLQFAAYVFDVSIQDIFTTLMRGGCVCVPSDQDRVNDLAGAINSMGVNWACITPTVASLLLPSDVPGLKTLSFAGEALTKKVIDDWSELESLNNCYGPAESTIYCAWNGMVGKTGMPSNIGIGLASLLWVVNVADYNRLAPVGCVGELLLEGPLLARGYLNDPEKTAASFITDPTWSMVDGCNGGRRMYRTGDLVRYNANGTLDYLGRRDGQVKLHGQRLELGEVEYHLTADDQVGSAMVMMPSMGHYKGRLLAITTSQDSTPASDSLQQMTTNDDIILVNGDTELASMQTSTVRDNLSVQVPVYMIPSVWITVESLPLNTSGKLDRLKVAEWVKEMDEDAHRQIIDAEMEVEQVLCPTTAMDRRLQQVLGRVLNVPPDSISLNRSFLSLGGDSITAMQVVSRGRAEGIAVKVQDILQSQTISQLALIAKDSSRTVLCWVDEVDKSFDLSPVQQMYFEMAGQKPNRFNQSFFLRMTRETRAQDVALTVEAVVKQHSMLRARFHQQDDGRWCQFISTNINDSYRFRLHEVKKRDDVTAIVAASQASLNVETGPVFAADMFNVDGDGQLLFLIGHHLVMDLVSWRVILQDFEEILESGSLSADKPFPFQAWIKLQAEYAQEHLQPSKVLPFEVMPSDYAYWGMSDRTNRWEDGKSESFIIDADTTTVLLDNCQDALGTEPVDVFLATLLHAFSQTFDDRATPTVFSEGHGREPWDSNVDLSETVGWFTTMSPLHVAIESNDSIVDTVRRTKDTRRKLPDNGWPYFASRFLNEDGMKAFADHLPIEVLFNYMGRYQQLEREDGLLRQEPLPGREQVSDVGDNVQRLALFEVSVLVVHGLMRFSVVYNRHVQQQTKVKQWMSVWEQCLRQAAERLSTMEADRTLSDFPLLSLTYPGLTKLKEERLQQVGVASFAEVEDVYPCSPMQQGLLLSQTRVSGSYEVKFMFEVVLSQASAIVDLDQLLAAWQQVIDRHAALRTVFVDSVSEGGFFDQIVLKRFVGRTLKTECEGGASEALALLNKQQPIDHRDSQPPHRLTVCRTALGRVLCKLEVSHAIIDAASMAIIYHELGLAYEKKLPVGACLSYSNYIKYLQQCPLEDALNYWKKNLTDVEPCHFPLLHNGSNDVRELRHKDVDLDLPPDALHSFCQQNQVTVPNVVQTVWGLLLRAYIGSDQVCFGYLASGRDVLVDGIEEAIGPFINMLICNIDVAGMPSIGKLVQKVQAGYLAGLEHQNCSLAQIQHELSLSGTPLFNTLMSVQRISSPPSSLKVATSSLSSSISSSLSASSESSSSSQSSRSSPDSSSWPSSDGKTEPPVIVCKSLDSHDPTEVRTTYLGIIIKS
jgi:amino acid adenylation domain-containing protein/non-ribosomal peptide synthase protein (TIGR01720 family)